MPQVGLEPMIPAFEWEKTFHVFDSAATETVILQYLLPTLCISITPPNGGGGGAFKKSHPTLELTNFGAVDPTISSQIAASPIC
jgi:hypothetical protein